MNCTHWFKEAGPCRLCLLDEVKRLEVKLLAVTEEFEDYKLNQLEER